MPVLYRDYRPKSFSELIDQEHVKRTLQNAIAQGNFAHAYLFTGPRGVGKTTAARIFARAINCLHSKDGEPDNSCEICKQFLEGRSLDLIEIDAASNTGVENIRDITEHLKFSPSQAKYKVFIIDEVHMLSKGAFNALLKTLEEPPQHAVFILATTEVHKVPATVTSRTQRFDFHKLDSTKLFEHLKSIVKKEKIEIDDQSLKLVISSAEGSGRDALSILDKLASFGKIDLQTAEQLLGITNVIAAQKFLDFLSAKDAPGALNFLENLFSGGADPVQFNKDFLEYLRKVLMIQFGANQNFILDQDQIEKLRNQASVIPQNNLLYIIRLFLRANKDFEYSPSVELPLEIAASEACVEQLKSVSIYGASPATSAAGATVEFKKKPENDELKASKESAVKASKPVSKSSSAANLTLAEIQKVWPAVLQKVKAAQSSLLTVLQNAKLRSVENGCITLVFEYKLHRDNLQKNADLLTKIIEQYTGQNPELNLLLEKEQPQQSDATDVALEVFGGELV